jgi:hypothetical protein
LIGRTKKEFYPGHQLLSRTRKARRLKVIEVMLCTARRALPPGITIDNHLRIGWVMRPESRARLRAMLAQAVGRMQSAVNSEAAAA